MYDGAVIAQWIGSEIKCCVLDVIDAACSLGARICELISVWLKLDFACGDVASQHVEAFVLTEVVDAFVLHELACEDCSFGDLRRTRVRLRLRWRPGCIGKGKAELTK